MSRVNGCHDRHSIAKSTWVQDGWVTVSHAPGVDIQARRMILIYTPWGQTCQYDRQQQDPGCTGCRNITKENE